MTFSFDPGPSDSPVAMEPATEPEATSTGPDVAAAARRVEAERAETGGKRKRGRPRGSRSKRTAGASEAETEAAPVGDAEIAEAAALGSAVWSLVAPFARCQGELSEPQSQRFGRALAPVLAKYVPMAGAFASEIALGLCVFGLWRETRITEPVAAEGGEIQYFDESGAVQVP